MKLLLYTDVHWSEYSSIVRSRGIKYSKRLENLISSVNWAEGLAESCDAVVCLGDFFDKPNLTSEEITALSEIKWCDKPHYFLVGNHDSNINDLSFASTYVFTGSDFHIISKPTVMSLDINSSTDVYLIPYIIESNRQSLNSYLTLPKNALGKTVIFSHNDIAGIQYGKFTSVSGFTIDEIKDNCDLFINGHLHNAGFVDEEEQILNLGNLTGQNFNEDAFVYRHFCAILDTDTLDIQFFENPYALNFYKAEISTLADLDKIKGPNAVVSLHCDAKIANKVRERLGELDFTEHRLFLDFDLSSVDDVEISELASVDYLQQFSEYVLSHLDNTEVLQQELSKVVI